VTFNHVNTWEWYQKRVYKVEAGYNPADKTAAFNKAQEWGDRIPIGVIYEQTRPTFEEQLPALSAGPLVKQKMEPAGVERLVNEFM
jgi:2-oxoglutarate ferredoxin oxidoreductase subunit beta